MAASARQSKDQLRQNIAKLNEMKDHSKEAEQEGSRFLELAERLRKESQPSKSSWKEFTAEIDKYTTEYLQKPNAASLKMLETAVNEAEEYNKKKEKKLGYKENFTARTQYIAKEKEKIKTYKATHIIVEPSKPKPPAARLSMLFRNHPTTPAKPTADEDEVTRQLAAINKAKRETQRLKATEAAVSHAEQQYFLSDDSASDIIRDAFKPAKAPASEPKPKPTAPKPKVVAPASAPTKSKPADSKIDAISKKAGEVTETLASELTRRIKPDALTETLAQADALENAGNQFDKRTPKTDPAAANNNDKEDNCNCCLPLVSAWHRFWNSKAPQNGDGPNYDRVPQTPSSKAKH